MSIGELFGRRGISCSSLEPLGIFLHINTDGRVTPFSVSLLFSCDTPAIMAIVHNVRAGGAALTKTTMYMLTGPARQNRTRPDPTDRKRYLTDANSTRPNVLPICRYKLCMR